MKLLVPDVNGADCCCVLQKFVMVWDIPPSNMLEVRHRIYTEAEKRFLDYIDIQLKDQKISNFSLKCIDYGDAKHKFDFPICHTDSLRLSLWKDLDGLQVENPESLSRCHEIVVCFCRKSKLIPFVEGKKIRLLVEGFVSIIIFKLGN